MRIATTWVALFAMLVTAPAWAGDDVDAITAELGEAGELAPDDAQVFKNQLRARLGDGQVCTGEAQAACRKQLRQQVRACHQLGKQTGRIENAADAAEVASAVMMMSAGGDVEQAGELVRAQLQHQWKAEQVGESAKQMRQLRHRWRHQTMKMLGACAAEGSCTPEDASSAVRAMKSASQRADLDARRVARTVRAAMVENAKKRGEARLQNRVQKRLRLKGEGGTEATVGEGEQQRHRYRHQMDGEGRRGGKFGGNASSGPGAGPGRRGGR